MITPAPLFCRTANRDIFKMDSVRERFCPGLYASENEEDGQGD